MVSMGISRHGVGQLGISPMGAKINQESYLEILENVHLQDRLGIFGPNNRRYTFMKDNEGPHAPAWYGVPDITQFYMEWAATAGGGGGPPKCKL